MPRFLPASLSPRVPIFFSFAAEASEAGASRVVGATTRAYAARPMTDRDGSDRTREDAEDVAAEEDAAGAPDEASEAEAAAGDEPSEEEAPKPKRKRRKKKRRKRRAGDDEAAAAEAGKGSKKKNEPPPLPGPGTPDGTKLREAHRAFDAGNYARVRELCRALESSEVPGVADAARDLFRRTTVDPAQIVVMVACAAVLAAIVWVWVI